MYLMIQLVIEQQRLLINKSHHIREWIFNYQLTVNSTYGRVYKGQPLATQTQSAKQEEDQGLYSTYNTDITQFIFVSYLTTCISTEF